MGIYNAFNKLEILYAHHVDGVQRPLKHPLIMEQTSEDAALKGKLASAILGRLDEGQHHWKWLSTIM